MIKETRYTGITAVPSDYDCPDGQLAESFNLLNEDGAMRPLFPPKTVLTLPAGHEIIFVHKTATYQHYIIRVSDTSLKWMNTTGGTTKTIRTAHVETISHVNAVGNTLLVFTETAIIYYLWSDNDYKELGDALPDVQISFGLIGRPRLYSVSDDSKSTFTISFDGIDEDDINGTFSEENKEKITSQVMAKVNKFVTQQTVNSGRFCFPFLVRYALRLYDGTLTYHSAPVLMNPSTHACPIVIWNHIKGKKRYTEAELDIMLVAANLDYQIIANDGYVQLENWSDIVKGVDIFISKPIYTFDQNGECSSFADSDNFETKFIGRLYNSNNTGTENSGVQSVMEDKFLAPANRDWEKFYSEWEYSKIFALYFDKNRSYPGKTLHLPEFSDDKVSETIRNTSTFYKLYSLDIAQLKASRTERKEIVIEDEYLQSLLARETLTDDYLSHDRLRASQSFGYNSRLNLSGVKRQLYDGFYLGALLAYKNVDFNWSGNKNNTSLSITKPIADLHDYSVIVYIKENNRDYAVTAHYYGLLGTGYDLGRIFSHELTYTNLVTGNTKTATEKHSWGCYFFYPNVNAYRMMIQDGASALIIDLQPHEFLNGAFAVLDYEREVKSNYNSSLIPNISYDPTGNQNIVDVPNKLYTSEVNNPFFFPVTGINTIGTGNIIGICSAAKALSQGQFGQFPLYAFTDEGVWALEVSSSGGFSARQPITRDVCLSPDSIAQIDSAVLFATNRGIMLISGSQTQCISDVLSSPDYFNVESLPFFKKNFIEFFHPECPFLEYIRNCRIAYDYTNQRIIIFNPDKYYSYVYSLKTKQWGMWQSSLTSVVNSYPEALAMICGQDESYLVDLADTDATSVRCLLVSRPLKFDGPDLLKTIATSIQRGILPKQNSRPGLVTNEMACVLYGTRDYQTWHLVGTSRALSLRTYLGTPYKAFRIVAVATMSKQHSIAGCSFDVIPRFTNRLR